MLNSSVFLEIKKKKQVSDPISLKQCIGDAGAPVFAFSGNVFIKLLSLQRLRMLDFR